MTVQIGGRDFHIGCDPEEQDNLRAAAEMLNSEIASLQDDTGSSRISLESCAVLAALNFAAELQRGNSSVSGEDFSPKITHLVDKIDSVLAE